VPSRAGVRLTGWGQTDPAVAELLEPRDASELTDAIALARSRTARGAIPRGMGRSYGDAAQLMAGVVLSGRGLSRFALDAERGLLRAEGGATLGEILAGVTAEGWMLPVVPGTQHVTVGGAIASDIHGKNHGTEGTFTRHVRWLTLAGSTGEVQKLEPGDELFWATAGGMGLTGLIAEAELQLRPLPGPLMSVDVDRVADLDEAFAALQAPGGAYRVAWLDLIASPHGRGVVTRAHHLPGGWSRLKAAPPAVPARAEVPLGAPGGLLRPLTLRAFNALRFRAAPRRARGLVEPLGHHLFPLDGLESWPRLYGSRGFLQYQFVVPFGREEAVRGVIELLHWEHLPPFLVVLKDFALPGTGGLSFPVPGWTLALDLARGLPGLDAALDRCDELVAEAGGRVYLTKDSRMRPEMLPAMYPELGRWREARAAADPAKLWRSDLSERTGLVAR
jgi:decaprenylphospho-beta-D-ribofuranose 2-oxidase